LNSNHNNLVKKLGIFFPIYLLVVTVHYGQNNYMPFNDMTYHWLDRFEVIYNNPTHLHLAIKGIPRKDVVQMVQAIDSINPDAAPMDLSDMQWLIDQNNDYFKEPKRIAGSEELLDSAGVF